MGTTNGHGSTKEVSVERELAVKLTEKELLERGDKMAEAEVEIEGLKAERSKLTGAINTQVKLRNELGHVIEKGEEKRTVLCKWHKNFAQNCWQLIRQDTGKEVEVKPMSAADRQSEIEFPTDVEPVDIGGNVVPMPGAKGSNGKAKRGSKMASPKVQPQTPVQSRGKGASKKKGRSKSSSTSSAHA